MELTANGQLHGSLKSLRKHLDKIVFFSLILVMSVAAFWGEYERLPIDNKYLFIAIFGVLMLSLLTHLKYAMGIFLIFLVVGANIPGNLSDSLGINHIALTFTLVVLVLSVLLNRFFLKLPTGVSKTDMEQNLANHGARSMFVAVEKRNLLVINTLLGFGIDPDIRAKGGETALMYAVSKNFLGGVKLLLKRGADVHAKNNEGHSAISVANIKNYRDLISVLKVYGA